MPRIRISPMPALGLPKSLSQDKPPSPVNSSVFQDAEEDSEPLRGIPMTSKTSFQPSPVADDIRFDDTNIATSPPHFSHQDSLGKKDFPADKDRNVSERVLPSQVHPVDGKIAAQVANRDVNNLQNETTLNGAPVKNAPFKTSSELRSSTLSKLQRSPPTEEVVKPVYVRRVNADTDSSGPGMEDIIAELCAKFKAWETHMKQTSPHLHRIATNVLMFVFVLTMVIMAYTRRLLNLPVYLCKAAMAWLENEMRDILDALPLARKNSARLFGLTPTAAQTATSKNASSATASTATSSSNLAQKKSDAAEEEGTPVRKNSRVSFSSIVSVKELSAYAAGQAGAPGGPRVLSRPESNLIVKEPERSPVQHRAFPANENPTSTETTNTSSEDDEFEFAHLSSSSVKPGPQVTRNEAGALRPHTNEKYDDIIMSPLSLETPAVMRHSNNSTTDSDMSKSTEDNSIVGRTQRQRDLSVSSGSVASRSVQFVKKKMSRTGSGLTEVARKVSFSRVMKRNKSDSETRFLSDRSARATLTFFSDLLMKEPDLTVALRRNGALKLRCAKRLMYGNHVEAKVSFEPRGPSSCVVVVYPAFEEGEETPLSQDYINFVSELQRLFVSAVVEGRN